MSAEYRLAERERRAKPLLEELESWLLDRMQSLSCHAELTKAFAYALNQWSALTYYTENVGRGGQQHSGECATADELGAKELPVFWL